MNILVVAPYGMYTEFSSSFIHNQVKELCRQGCKVTVIVPVALFKRVYSGGVIIFPKKTVVDDVEIYFVSYLSLSSIGQYGFNIASALVSVMVFIRRNCKKILFDFIWVHTFGFGEKIGYALKHKYNKPLILTTHGGDTERFTAYYGAHRAEKTNLLDGIIAVSPKLSRKLEDLRMGVPIKCIENGFCTENLVELPKEWDRVIQVGNLVESKHYEITLEAISMVKEKGISIHLDIVGEGAKKKELEALVREKGLDDCVIFYGHLDNKKVMRMMAAANFFVMPSYPEGLGIVYLEALGEGCITIGTKGEGIDGIIQDGVNGFLVDRNDSSAIARIIETCIVDKGLREYIVQNARTSAGSFSWEKNARRNLDAIGYFLESREKTVL